MTMDVQTSMLPLFAASDKAFGDSVFYSVLTPNALRAVRGHPVVRVLGRHSIIHAMGKVPEEVFTLCSGWAFRYILLPDGRRHILTFYLPGDLISPQAMYSHPLWFSVQALTEVTLSTFNRESLLLAVFEEPELRTRFASLCASSFENQDRRVVTLGRLPAVERVGMLFCNMESRFIQLNQVSEDGSFPFVLRQEHIADALGLTRVHVSRVLGQMRSDGIVKMEEGRMRILDRKWFDRLARHPNVYRSTPEGIFAS